MYATAVSFPVKKILKIILFSVKEIDNAIIFYFPLGIDFAIIFLFDMEIIGLLHS